MDPDAYRPAEPPTTGRQEPPAWASWPRRAVLLALVAMLALGAAGGGVIGAALVLWLMPAQVSVATASAPQPTPVAQAVANIQNASDSSVITRVYNDVSPAVVLITNRGQRASGSGGGAGSGFIIDKDGLIVTNNHVVQGSSRLTVTLSDGQELPAEIVGTAPGHDLALIKIAPPADGLTVSRLGDSDAVVPGEMAVAIGSPLGFERTVTSGIVSSTGRTFGGGGRPLRGLIQTDTAINPGNSGGPLLNAHGEVIGVNTLRAPESQGIGFAVAVNTVKRLLPQLQAGGRVSSPYLGIRGIGITQQSAQSLQLPVTQGVLVIDVIEGGPAAQAGIRGGPATEGQPVNARGDIIAAINNTPVRQVEEISTILDSYRAGDTVSVTVLRDGQTLTLDIVLAEWPDS